jgi:adenylate cyclase
VLRSIAVLPFDAIGLGKDRSLYGEGIAEDIINNLSRFRGLFVIARNSSFACSGSARLVREIGRELGVRYVLQGARMMGGLLRVTAELADAVTERQVWAESYDRPADEIFAVQDEPTSVIVATLVGRVESAELQLARRKPTGSLAAYELVLRGKQLLRRHQRKGELASRLLFEEVIRLDPDYAIAHVQLALTHLHEFFGTTR